MRSLYIPALLCTMLALSSISEPTAEAPMIEFDTAGGDAWTFKKQLSGYFQPGACDAVRLDTPSDSSTAALHGNRFLGRIPLRSGSNEIRAVCIRNQAEVARSKPQLWSNSLPD